MTDEDTAGFRNQDGSQSNKGCSLSLHGDQKDEMRVGMKANNGRTQSTDKRDIRLNYYPTYEVTIDVGGGEDQSTCHKSNKRVCPYCQSIIPAKEDPCHVCGHLEPAEVVKESAQTSRDTPFFPQFWVAFLLVSGVAMIIWPSGNPIQNYECDLFDADDCMLPFLIWSRPGDILLVLYISIVIGWNAISKYRQKKV